MLGIGSKETKVIWNGEYGESEFREKVDKLLLGESRKSLNLKLLESNVERVKRVWELFEPISNFVDKCTGESTRYSGKCAETANKLRQEGNEFYQRKNFSMALRGFTLSLFFAPMQSKELVLAYSNRSACFMEMNQFENCRSNIEKALEIFKDTNLDLQAVKNKLLEREARCATKLKEKSKLDDYAKVFTLQNPSKSIESAEEFVEIRDNLERGRHVVVTKDVDPGTVIILEEPYSKTLVKQFRWEIDFCHYCFKDISNVASIPCSGCCFALYCNYNCFILDSSLHNFYECKISGSLHSLKLGRLVNLAFRTLVKFGARDLYDFWKKSKPVGGVLGFDEFGKYVSSSYYPIYYLVYHDQSLKEQEIFQYCLDSILLIELLDKKTDFFKSVAYEDFKGEVEEFKYFAASILVLHQMNFPCNAHSLNALQLPRENPSSDDIVAATTKDFGAGAFALLSMINHSCDPNVARITLSNGLNAVVTIKKLSASDEVLDNYGCHFALQDLKERQKHLQDFYNFKCDCLPCKNKWPKMDVLESLENRFMCPNCSSQFKRSDCFKKSFQDCIIDRTRSSCKKCQTKFDINILNEDLQKQVDKFHTAYNILLQNKPLDCIPILVDCLKYVESHVLPPCITANFVQETLKQAFNLMAINNNCD